MSTSAADAAQFFRSVVAERFAMQHHAQLAELGQALGREVGEGFQGAPAALPGTEPSRER